MQDVAETEWTICDACSAEIPQSEANDSPKGGVLCNHCADEESLDDSLKQLIGEE